MRRNLSRIGALLGALALVAALTGPATASNGPLVAVLRGANEVPGPGDANGRGVALVRRVSLDGANDKLCYFIVTNKIDLPATGAHVHIGAAGVAGAVQVTLGNPTKKTHVMGQGIGMSRGCAEAADTLLQAIWDNPSGYYVNVHNAAYPAGAIRGQLK